MHSGQCICVLWFGILCGFLECSFLRVESTEIVIFSLKYFVCRIPESLIFITSFISLYLQTGKVRPQILLSRVPFAKGKLIWYTNSKGHDPMAHECRRIMSIALCLKVGLDF